MLNAHKSSTDKELVQIPLPYRRDSLELFQKIRHLPLPVLLNSGSKTITYSNNTSARFDILTSAPEKILRTIAGITSIELVKDGSLIASSENPIDILAEQFSVAKNQVMTDPDLPFSGGAIGYFSYELLHNDYKLGRLVDEDISLPEMLIGIYQWSVIVDHQLQQCSLVFQPDCSKELQSTILQCLSEPAITEIGDFRLTEKFSSNFSFEEYEKAYQSIIDYIYAGDCYQVNLAQRFSAAYNGDPLQAFQNLNARADAPFSAYIQDGNQAVLSFSPERFIKVTDKQVLTQPIKGTRPRHSDPIIDQQNLTDLINSEKDKAENLMIVDLLRNDLGRVSKTGSVSVENLFEAHSFTNVHHLISTIKSELNTAEDVFELFKTSFPGGSITGTPKIRSMEIISELETRSRSVYCGSIAYIDFNGNMDSSICIRSLVLDQGKVHCWGGGAIVVDSLAELEYQETLDKISILLNNLQE